MSNYFRVTAYHPTEDVSAIFDSFGKFKALWELSSYLVQKGFKIISVCNIDKLAESTFPKLQQESDKIHLRAVYRGMPEIEEFDFQNRKCRMITLYDKIYAQFI